MSQKIFSDTRILDKAACDIYGLTEDIMMENAAAALEKAGREHFFYEDKKYISRANVLILCGGGNNGADGYALARRIIGHELGVTVCKVCEPKSQKCVEQCERAQKCGILFTDAYDLDEYLERMSFDLTVVYDCIFGSGFHGELDPLAAAVIESVNKTDAYKIACDIPTGGFKADETVTMGALKLPLFSDRAKDLCGKITVADMGISRDMFEFNTKPAALLLEADDARIPVRGQRQNVNKGSFGHTAVIAGTKPGAAVIAGHAALRFGSGLVTLVAGKNCPLIPYDKVADFELMRADSVPANTSALVIGPGLGRPDSATARDSFGNIESFLTPGMPMVLDADIFYYPEIRSIIEKNKIIVLTPHPKEFAELLKNCSIKKEDGSDYTTGEVVKNRFRLVREFCLTFPDAVLLLKGANVLIGQKKSPEEDARIYVNDMGSSALSKGGSGDVLSGMTGALLAQGYEPLDAAASASICHGLASRKFDRMDFSLTPFELISRLL